MVIKAIVLDFDGVVLESVDIKTRAFRELFKDYSEQLDRIVQFHLNNAGISRFEKFRVIYRDYLGRPLDDEEMDRLAGAFSRLVLEEVLRCPFVPGAQQFLQRYHLLYPLFLASATPTEELKGIVAARDLEAFFKGIFGYPPDKAAILRRLMAEHRWRTEELLFVGDALNDYQVAREVGVPFVGRVGEGQANPFPAEALVVENLAQLDRQWPLLLEQLTEGDKETE